MAQINFDSEPGKEAMLAKKKMLSKNPILKGLSGRVGDFIFKQFRGRTIIAIRPKERTVVPSPLQKQNCNRFKEATQCAKTLLSDPEKREAFARKHKGCRTLYQAAVGYYLRSMTHSEIKGARKRDPLTGRFLCDE
jgi:hypothetical protein